MREKGSTLSAKSSTLSEGRGQYIVILKGIVHYLRKRESVLSEEKHNIDIIDIILPV